MESPDDVYDWVDDDVEDLEFYCQGGYYPITISDTLQSPRTTYVVLHKLGFGSYSTVWLARDTQTSRLVSLKLGTAHAADEDIASRSDELTILAHLADNVTPAPGSQYILSLLDSFEVESPNGTHTCLVMEPHGPSILDFCNRCEPYRLPGGFARIVCPQLAAAVEYLHSRGIVHGDLHSRNILFQIPSFSMWTSEEVTARLGVPYLMPVKRCDGGSPGPSAPLTVVRPCHPKKLIQFCLEDPKICVTDFGESFFTADRNPNRELQTAVSVAAPEILLEYWSLVGPPCDIWSLACMLWEILSNTMLFTAIFPRRRHLLVEIETTLDSANLVPPGWRSKVPEGRKVNRGLQVRMAEFNKHVDEGHRFDELELAELTRLFDRMLKWDPRDRITAADVMEGLPSW